MNHPRKKAAVKKHFSEPYETQEQLRTGLKADEAGYTDVEIEEIMEAIKEQVQGPVPNTQTIVLPAIPESMSTEEKAEFEAWKESKKALNPASISELAKAVTAVAPKIDRYKDFDVFQGKTVKKTVANPFNPTQPNNIILEIKLGERKRLARIEPALAYEFNEYATGQETGLNHGEVSTAEYYFPIGRYATGASIPFVEFAAYQRQDIRYAEKYHPHNNISLLVAAGYGSAIN